MGLRFLMNIDLLSIKELRTSLGQFQRLQKENERSAVSVGKRVRWGEIVLGFKNSVQKMNGNDKTIDKTFSLQLD